MKGNDRVVQLADVLEAIEDQSRIVIALQGNFANATEAAKRLVDLGIPPVRVAALLGKPLTHITSALAKARKRAQSGAVVGEMGAGAGEIGLPNEAR